MNKIDARDKQCPIPIVMLKNAIKEHGRGNYQLLVDNVIAVENIQKFCNHFNYDFDFEQDNNEYECRIDVTKGSKSKESNNSVLQKKDKNININQKNNTVYLFDNNVLGDGDKKLGLILIKGFIFALSHGDDIPNTIVCYNNGVRLVCENSECIEDLKVLEGKGTKIVACGTCLDYYGLTNSTKIGSICNMYEIVNYVNEADKLVRL